MGIFKKIYILFFMFLFATLNVQAAQKTSIAVIPVTVKVQGSNEMAYPKACSLISADITNKLSSLQNFSVSPITTNEKIIAQKGLAPKYNEFLTTYKTRYLIDYDILQEIADALEADQILLVQGGFDLQQVFLSRPLTYKLGVPEASPVLPLYKYNVAVNLVDPHNKTVLMHKNYDKNFKVREFGIASDNFAENVVPVSEIKKFSKSVSYKVVNNINRKLAGNSITAKKTNTISTNAKVQKKDLATDGTVTTDGHPFSVQNSTIKTKRQENYENWALDNL